MAALLGCKVLMLRPTHIHKSQWVERYFTSGLKGKKSKPATEAEWRKYEEQKKLRDQWRYDTAAVTSIIETMREKYGQYKGDFALSRYEELKAMIKEAIAHYKELEKTIKARTDSKASAIAAKYMKDAGGGGGGGGGGERTPNKPKGITSLTKSAANFASGDQPPEDSPQDMSAKDIDEALTKFRKEILQLKQDFRSAKEKLDKLDTEYQHSKKQAPPQRYQTMKDIIKGIIQ